MAAQDCIRYKVLKNYVAVNLMDGTMKKAHSIARELGMVSRDNVYGAFNMKATGFIDCSESELSELIELSW